MKAEEFNPEQFERGRKYAVDLELGSHVSGVNLNVLLVRGRTPGKTLVALAGVHGDEYEGVRAVLDTYSVLDAEEMSGDFLSVPIANPPAFWAASRTSPLDGENLARMFPGSFEEGPTAAIAALLSKSLISRGDFLLDLHSAGVKLLMPTMVGYDSTDSRSRQAALEFGASVIWGHAVLPPGRTISFAKSLGIPWLYTEARGAGRIYAADLEIFRSGIQNLLRHLSILPGEPQTKPVEFHLEGDGNIDAAIEATHRGILIPAVEILQRVGAGEQLGRTVDLHGETLEVFQSSCEGVVALIRQCLSIEPGDTAFLIAGEHS